MYPAPNGEITKRVIDIERINTDEHTGERLVVAFYHRRGAYRTFNASRILWNAPADDTCVTDSIHEFL